MFCAAETSAAIASRLSHDQCAKIASPSAWRRKCSAMAASRRADAAASARVHAVIAAITAASSASASCAGSGNVSSIFSILVVGSDTGSEEITTYA